MLQPFFKHIIPITLFALLALLSWWLKDTASPTKPSVDGKIRHDPDYYAENLVTFTMDQTGNVNYRLAVSHVEHFPDDDRLQLLKPQMIFYQDQHPQWTITSENGVVTANGKEILLSNNVVAIQSAKNNIATMKLTTEDLLIRPEKKYAETQSDVYLQGRYETMHAKGMKADIEKSKIQFLSNVKGVYITP